ncbi:hypothetical protein PF008_g18950 [Phytophthora fragariae]|uniref:SET domain-containing protein n=1 Tax=Phytophthora fragariae TaxID=53985 RepID=A0A6G0R3Z4_9STRA|nr:hypothetical protein PF008_g18950 [Phytophthora fragariae]
MKTEAGAVIDVTEDASASASDASSGRSKRSREEPPAPARRTHRKTESRVLFSDVMAQEREMERITHAKSRAPMLRKGETAESPVQRSKQKRTEERRSARQKLRRNMSPRSPDGGPQPLRTGVALPALDGVDAALQPQRRFARDEDAIQDATLHSTAWRNVRLEAAPANVLPDTEGLLPPYALQLDAPLEAFDAELRSKCALSAQFLKPKSLSLTSGSLAEEKEKTLLDDRVKALVDEATPLVKNSHAARANAVIANTRQQIAAYLEQRLVVREQTMAISGLPLDVSKLEKVAARRLLRDAEFVPEGMDRPHYSIGRTEADHSGRIYPEMVTYLSKIAPIPRSTTCMLARGTHRVEDDPIIRFVPYFSAAKNKPPEFTSADRCKDTLVGMDNEINEYVLRYVVRQCGGDQSVFEALQRCGAFNQPFANYSDILERVTREQLYKRHLQELEERRNSDEIPVHRKRAIDSLLKECSAVRDGAYLRGRLQPLPSHVVVNHLQQSGDLGVRRAPSEQFRELAIKYQDFFCRRCCAYSCRNHGREQPVPVVRVDPSYPVVKAASKLWRRVEEKLIAEEQAQDYVDDTDVQMDSSDRTPESDEPMSELTPGNDTNKEKDSTQESENGAGNTAGSDSTRRSLRAQTAASTKASSQLNAARLHIKKMVRSKTTDVSEYLGFDGVYQALTQDQKLEILSDDALCGPHCSKSETAKPTTVSEKSWESAEVALLNKLEKSVGSTPCVLAVLLATRTCAEVAKFLQQRESQVQGGLHDPAFIRSGAYGRNRERSNGVLGNSYEHLRRTRFQRMKDRGMRLLSGLLQSFSWMSLRDVCTSCGASELPVVIADPKSKTKTVAQLKICGNVNIMRGQMRKIGVAASATHGWGAYALEDAEEGDFMYEYTGSLLSQDEAERRGNVYDKTTISFLFDLNEDSVVDATRKGNKSKFANHDSAGPKCFARIMLVNGDHRIGIYAKEDITTGDELFFDYGYSGVIPDWSQARIGSGKDAPSMEEEEDAEATPAEVKQEAES